MTQEKQFITTGLIKRNTIKLPNELAVNPMLPQAKVEVTDDVVTFTLPPKNTNPDNIYAEIWQYVHRKEKWVNVTFTK
jgi:hypothetical protein